MNPVDPGGSEQPLPNEASLVREAKSGVADAFARLYEAYVGRIYRYIYFRVTDDQAAEDLTSQVFLKAWERLDRYQASGPFQAWLYTIARNQVIDYYRTRKESIPLEAVSARPADHKAVDDQVEGNFELQAMRNALQFLTADQQQVLILKFIAELSTAEIARMLHKQEGAIRALQMRALQTLAKYMDGEQ